MYGPPPYQGYSRVEEKEPIIALILPGVGQIYCEKVARGVTILLVVILINVFTMLTFCGMSMSSSMFDGIWVGSILVGIVSAIIWIWNIVDAYQLANQWNDIARTGRRPW